MAGVTISSSTLGIVRCPTSDARSPPKGTLVVIGGSAGRWIDGLGRANKARALSPFVSQRLHPFLTKWSRQDLNLVKELIEAGKVTPVIDRTYPLSQAPEAIRHLEGGHARGKIVITV